MGRDKSPPRARYEYDDRLDDVSRALGNLDRPGDCFVSGSLPNYPPPGVEIRGADNPGNAEQLPLPLTDDMAKRVITKCRLAPYGQGEKTLVNTDVRNTWELNANEIAITNPQWTPFVQSILRAIREPLGIAKAAQVDAKLYKLLLYEEGGKFGRHQDSEKEPGMFGTLVVVLPCTFTGGDLVVHDPSTTKCEPHVWSPSTESAFDIKYAAFYGDCAHEVKPVTSGYRLCLTYNLVTTTVADIPRFAGSTKVQEAIEWTLSHFFTEPVPVKRPRYSWSDTPAVASSHRHFVYILDHDYSDQGLRFEYLKNKDYLVPHSLARFCEQTKGSPWVKYGTTRAAKCPDVNVDHLHEVAPSGYLETVEFHDIETEYTGNEGTREDQWYDTAALVIQPITKEFDQLAKAGAEDAAATLVQLLDAGSPNAAAFAGKFLARAQDWTSTSPGYATTLEMTVRLGDVSLFFALLRNVKGFEFQPKLRDVVLHFGWDSCLPALLAVGHIAKPRSRINLVASVLHGEVDTARIASLMEGLEVTLAKVEPPKKPESAWRKVVVDPFTQPTVDEYCRILHFAHQVSSDTLARHTVTSNDETLVHLMVPAFQSFATSLSSLEAVAGLAQSLHEQLQSRLPALRNAGFREIKVDHSCVKCTILQEFLSSDVMDQMHLVAKHKTESKHLESVLKRTRGYRTTASISYRDIGAFTFEVNKVFGEDKLYEAACAAVQHLGALVSSTGSSVAPSALALAIEVPPMQPLSASRLTPRSLPPLASVIHTPRPTDPPVPEPEIIVINDDSD